MNVQLWRFPISLNRFASLSAGKTGGGGGSVLSNVAAVSASDGAALNVDSLTDVLREVEGEVSGEPGIAASASSANGSASGRISLVGGGAGSEQSDSEWAKIPARCRPSLQDAKLWSDSAHMRTRRAQLTACPCPT